MYNVAMTTTSKTIVTTYQTSKERREEFVRLYAQSGNATQAARAVGYSEKGLTGAAARLTRELSIEIQQAVAHNIASSAPTALLTMMQLMKDDTVADSVRLQAAKDILDRSGYGAANRIEISSQLDNKSDNELRAELRQLMNNVIDVTPDE